MKSRRLITTLGVMLACFALTLIVQSGCSSGPSERTDTDQIKKNSEESFRDLQREENRRSDDD
jgi:predicted component of type VI protein secretion system